MQQAIVWSRENCHYCELAKNLLKTHGIEFEERRVGDGWSREQLLEVVPTARSVPQIFINNEHIGGWNELRSKLQ